MDFVSNVARNPWNGAVTVGLIMSNGPPTQIGINMTNLPREACIQMTTSNTNPNMNQGLGFILINGASLVTSFPYTVASAATACTTTNSVYWAYLGLN